MNGQAEWVGGAAIGRWHARQFIAPDDKERDRMGQSCRAREETLRYIGDMLVQLGVLARAEGYVMLAYFIEMASMEASDMACGVEATETGRGLSVAQHKGNGSA